MGNPNLPGGRWHAQKIAQCFNTRRSWLRAALAPDTATLLEILSWAPMHHTDVNASKRFAITHDAAVVFRGELFNLFNNVNFNNPNGTVGNGKAVIVRNRLT
jgi:hypothetical protein